MAVSSIFAPFEDVDSAYFQEYLRTEHTFQSTEQQTLSVTEPFRLGFTWSFGGRKEVLNTAFDQAVEIGKNAANYLKIKDKGAMELAKTMFGSAENIQHVQKVFEQFENKNYERILKGGMWDKDTGGLCKFEATMVAYHDRSASYPRFVWCGLPSKPVDLMDCPPEISPDFYSTSGYVLHELL